MLHIGEPEFAQFRTPRQSLRSKMLSETRGHFPHLSQENLPPRATAGGGTAVTLSAERGTRRFAVAAGILLVSYEPWSSSIFRSLTE
jgi:hypothetical protein